MKKNFLKKSTATFLCALMIIPFTLSVNAAGTTVTTTEIPVKMAPESTIEFITDTEYTILKGEKYDDSSLYAKIHNDQVVKEDNNSLEETENIIHEEPIAPKAGMVVTYADDGYILNIQVHSPNARSENGKCPKCDKSHLPNKYFKAGAHI